MAGLSGQFLRNIFRGLHLFCPVKTSLLDEKDARNFSPDFSGEKFYFRPNVTVFASEKLQVFRAKNFTETEIHFPLFPVVVDSNALPDGFRLLYRPKIHPKTAFRTAGGRFYSEKTQNGEKLLNFSSLFTKILSALTNKALKIVGIASFDAVSSLDMVNGFSFTLRLYLALPTGGKECRCCPSHYGRRIQSK